jgi:TRAP-type C4-dicarboxylate transport system substrate-binding protein
MPKIPKTPVAAGMMAYSLWQRLTPEQRRVLLEAARTHGPRVAAAARTHGPKVAAVAAAATQARKKR